MGTLGRAAAEMRMKKLTYIGIIAELVCSVPVEVELGTRGHFGVSVMYSCSGTSCFRNGTAVRMGPGCCIRQAARWIPIQLERAVLLLPLLDL